MGDYVDIKGIAALLRRSPKTVRDRLVHEPGFPPPAIMSGPRSRYWLRDSILAWATPGVQQSLARSLGSKPATANSRPDAR